MQSPPDPEALPQPSVSLVAPGERPPRGPRRPREPRPDHFLALRLSHSPAVTSAVAAIQTSIVEHSPHLGPALVDPAAAHITLGVLSLRDAAAREAAAAALPGAAAAAGLKAPCVFTLRGAGHFKNEVVWIGVGDDDGGAAALAALAAAVRGRFHEAGLLLQADREFVPHVTVVKCSKMQPWGGGGGGARGKRRRGQGRGRGGQARLASEASASGAADEDASEAASEAGPGASADKNASAAAAQQLTIPPEAYAAQSDVTAAVEVGELQLCAMAGRRPGGYYPVVAACSLVAPEAELGAEGFSRGAGPMEKGVAGEAIAAEGGAAGDGLLY